MKTYKIIALVLIAVMAAGLLAGCSGEENVDYIQIKGTRYQTSLTELALGNMDLQDEDIVNLQYMTNLTRLNLRNNQISDLTPLSNLTGLTYLNVNNNRISDITSLSNLTNLNNLRLRDNPVDDWKPLFGFANLTTLYHDSIFHDSYFRAFDNSYSFGGYDVGTDESGNTTVTLYGRKINGVGFTDNIKVSGSLDDIAKGNYTISSPALCEIEADGKTYHDVNIAANNDFLRYSFDTAALPTKITLTNGDTKELIISFNVEDELQGDIPRGSKEVGD